ncbi:retrovirus-related pol polyprotein from transposon 17.6 [Plakobranchus ocellatus]|uniref:Retrovirus-related pol polyprotein from transposon 17.6 n=1 Tax=Plakobranchus ocellatus TaxID=259542 RepID=A0AAV3XZJ0_9GAST|nr:retrovirus-related pol polyprotein from transposon 17.6 [Plakobranchus ocellatus]
MKVDTEAETSSIPEKLWEKIKRKPRLRESRMTLKAFGNTKIENEGTANVPISVGEKQIRTEIFATKGQTTPILGLQACMKLNLIQKGKNGQHIQANAIDLVKKQKNQQKAKPIDKTRFARTISRSF